MASSSAAAASSNGASAEQQQDFPIATPGLSPSTSDLLPDSAATAKKEDAAPSGEAAPTLAAAVEESNKWPGWPGQCVFRMVVPVIKVGSIIGRKGELIKKMSEESGAKIRILDGALGTVNRIVLVSGKEEPDAEISPAMDAMLRVFKRVNEISGSDGDGASTAVTITVCSVRLLVASSQAVSLIGKGGAAIKSIQEESGGIIRVLPGEELPFYAGSDERVVDIQGDSVKVLKALELVLGHLRRFLVDQSVLPLFDKIHIASGTTAAQDRAVDTWADKQQSSTKTDFLSGLGGEPSLSSKSDSLFRDQIDVPFARSSLSLYGQDPAVSGLSSSGLGRSAASAVISQITQTMQIPLSFAEDIIGIGGANIAYIRRTSGAILSVHETRGHPDEVTVEIKGSSAEVQTAQQLIQEFIAGHNEPTGSGYRNPDLGYRSSYSSQFGGSSYSYPSSSLTSRAYGGYGSYDGYGSYRY